MQFYLGSPEPSWLRRCRHLPLFISHNRLVRLVNLPRALTPWALDSGGFTEVTARGGWTTSPETYVRAVARYDAEIGGMEWAAPQDWMVEPQALAATGLTAAEHLRRTVANLPVLRELWPQYSDASCPIVPSLQGDSEAPTSADDHLSCIGLYEREGIDLVREPLVGIGSVCRLQSTNRIGAVAGAIADALPGVPLHGFGLKIQGLSQVAHLLASADSQAWSRGARYPSARRLPECTHAGPCTWCARRALAWRAEVLTAAGQPGTCAWFDEHGDPPWSSRAR